MINYVFGLITAFSITVPFLLLKWNKLKFGRDYFFLLVYLQVIIYVHVAPTFAILEVSHDLKFWYIWLALVSLFFFELPFVWNYCRLRQKFTKKSVILFDINHFPSLILSIVFVFASVWFLSIAFEFQVFFKRIGPYSLRERMASITPIESVFYRLYYKSALFLAALFLLLIKSTSHKTFKKVYISTFTIVASTILVYDLVNNRLATLILLAYLFGIAWFFSETNKNMELPVRKMFVLGCYLLSSLWVVNNLRKAYYEREYWIWTDPFFVELTEEQNTDSLKWRLNGIDLIARISPIWYDNPHLDFQAYKNSFLVSLGWGSKFSEEQKDNLSTAIKNHLMLKHLSWDLPDYYSCCLTDLYGCFNILGLLFGGFLYSYLIFGANYALFYAKSPPLRIWGLFFMPFCLYFEYEFTNLLWSWLKTLPLALLFITAQILKNRPCVRFTENIPTNGLCVLLLPFLV